MNTENRVGFLLTPNHFQPSFVRDISLPNYEATRFRETGSHLKQSTQTRQNYRHMDSTKPRIARITIGRLYNLGSYEHVRYELAVEVPDGASAAEAMKGAEKIITGLSPLKNACIESETAIERKRAEIEEMRKMPVAQWEREYGHCKGTPLEVIRRYEDALEKAIKERETALNRATRARELFDDLGGAAQWKDAKLDWDDDDYEA